MKTVLNISPCIVVVIYIIRSDKALALFKPAGPDVNVILCLAFVTSEVTDKQIIDSCMLCYVTLFTFCVCFVCI